jgi:RES domain-containing protein
MAKDQGEPQRPPTDLAARKVHLSELPAGRWSRIHRATLDACFYSESPGNRFSSSGLGVLYLADAPLTAFWEAYWDDLGTRAPDDRRIGRSRLNQRVVRGVEMNRVLRVFDALDATSLKVVGAATGTFSGNYSVCQDWAKALYDHVSKPDGLLYPSARHGGGRCLAMFAARTDCGDLTFDLATPVGESVELMRALLGDRVEVLDD